MDGLGEGRRARRRQGAGKGKRGRAWNWDDHKPLIATMARRRDETRGLVIRREEHGDGARGVDFFPIYQRRLMKQRDRGYFTDGDIEERGRYPEHEETQSARDQRPASRE